MLARGCELVKYGAVRPESVAHGSTGVPGRDTLEKMRTNGQVSGPKAGTWSCTVTPPDGDPVTAEGLKVTPRFRTLDWIGFMSNGKEGTWHLDDFSVEPVPGTDCAMPSSPCSAGITHRLYHVDLIQCTRYAK